MSEAFECPLCGKPLQKRQGQKGAFWSCAGYPDCKFSLDDQNGKPLILKCPKCGAFLRAGSNSRGPYTYCSKKENHASGETLFFGPDGNARQDEGRQKPKGTFTCPECGQELKYFRQKKGKNAGQMCWACFNEGAHDGGKALFFNDDDGAPRF